MEALLRRAVILVALDEDFFALQDEQAHGAIAAKETVHVVAPPVRGRIANRRLGRRARKLMHGAAARDPVRRISLVEVAEQADQALLGPEVGIVEPADRIALGFYQTLIPAGGATRAHHRCPNDTNT